LKRLRELDFLRGIAILLVLCRHAGPLDFTIKMGWIGVDLFFVLSGFLVSGLLFKEYLKFGNIKPTLFLIRRGFKIYPIYFLFYIIYLVTKIYNGEFNMRGFISDMTFTQNYVWGFGYAYAASWSLAVEEHFYFGFTLLLWFALKRQKIILEKTDDARTKFNAIEINILFIFVVCLILRIISNLVLPIQSTKTITMTHLRIDSLLAGVLISHLYYFRFNYLNRLFKSFKYLLAFVAFAGLIWTPFIEPSDSFFAKTFGFSFVSISFSIVLVYFLLKRNINQVLDKIFTSPIVNIISKIGYCSYSIYIIHTFVIMVWSDITEISHLPANPFLTFLVSSALSVIAGIFMTYKIENYFLNLRSKYYPGRVHIVSTAASA
jgi:peptidoglycan/LPS O-acetylase OafA/YrhL